jgi:hypothetical protein
MEEYLGHETSLSTGFGTDLSGNQNRLVSYGLAFVVGKLPSREILHTRRTTGSVTVLT